MSSLDKAVQTQLENIQKKTGKSLDELAAIVKKSGLTKHGEIRDMLKENLGWAMAMQMHSSTPCFNRMASALQKARPPMLC